MNKNSIFLNLTRVSARIISSTTIAALIVLFALLINGCDNERDAAATPALTSEDVTHREWYDNKYSMFIHWGIYSELGGVWEGEPVTRGYSEQIQAHAGIYSDVYASTAGRFNPRHWNPDSIVLLAKASGMRSVVITSKHHDGFCMFDSDYTDFNVVKATPYGRDVVGELADACRRHGLNFGLYFSLIDWHYPPAYPISSHNADYIPDEHHTYNMSQVRELLTRYGPISELWFDMGSLEPEQSRELRELVHSLQPGCMVSGRLGNDQGDFTVMGDNQYPDYTLDTPWQTPASMFDETWSYRTWQERGDPGNKIIEKLKSLIMVVGRGGNYLLNIGPRGDGSVVEFERDVLLGIGRWLETNGEAIYGTRPAGFDNSPPWGEITRNDNRLYLILTDPPAEGVISLSALTGEIEDCFILDSPAVKPEFTSAGKEISIRLPGEESFEDIRVVVLQFAGSFDITRGDVLEVPPFGETFVLGSFNSHNHYSFSGVDYYSTFRSIVRQSWNLSTTGPCRLEAAILYSEAEKGREIILTIAGSERIIKLEGGESIQLDADLSALQFAPLLLNGPHSARIDAVTGSEQDLDPGLPWPHSRGRRWQPADKGTDGLIKMPAGRNHCWYGWQQITSRGDSRMLLRIRRTDGVQVFLNGNEIYLHNNPDKKELMEDLVLLDLRDGKNDLLVKFYNRFGNTIIFSLDHEVPQTLYRKQTDNMVIEEGGVETITRALHNPVSVHSNLAMPNLKLELTRIPK